MTTDFNSSWTKEEHEWLIEREITDEDWAIIVSDLNNAVQAVIEWGCN
jgi:5-bromo-4-chloroindolyl phosphate hydrolysis protein